MAKLLIVYNKNGETAAHRLEELIFKNKNCVRFFKRDMTPGGIVKWDEKHWLDNHFTKDGEVCGGIIFIGDIKDTKEMRETSTVLFKEEKWGVLCRQMSSSILISAETEKLVHNKDEYEKFRNELQVLSPNGIEEASHGMRKVIKFFEKGIKGIRQNRDNIEKEQLLYAVNRFSEKCLNIYIDKIMRYEEIINGNSDGD